jgi:hypothetical protein
LKRWIALLAALGACRYSVRPDQGKFHCANDADCGSGWHCNLSCQRSDFTPYCIESGICDAGDPCPSFESDPSNCGSCGVVCASGNCINNTCVALADAG